MGRKKGHLVILKPFCYYCDKEFNNELILHQHQKARHFKCVKCNKRFSTAPALDTHNFQVHHENLKRVPNAKSGRDNFDISIYGMDGVPLELINYKLSVKVEQKKKKLIQENKIQVDEKEKNENDNFINNINNKEKKDQEIANIIQNSSNTGGFYHNPNSINLTLKQRQMNQMYMMSNSNNIINQTKTNNTEQEMDIVDEKKEEINNNEIKEEDKNIKQENEVKKIENKPKKKEKEMTLENLNDEID